MSPSTAEVSPEVRDPLLEAWRGEIVAGPCTTRSPTGCPSARRRSSGEWPPRRAVIASGSRREWELGIPVPPEDSVRLSAWQRLQAGIAPVDRLLAAREAAEDEEVDDLYKRSTGDPDHRRLLRGIRKEERSHSMAVSEIRSGVSDAPAPAMTPRRSQRKSDSTRS